MFKVQTFSQQIVLERTTISNFFQISKSLDMSVAAQICLCSIATCRSWNMLKLSPNKYHFPSILRISLADFKVLYYNFKVKS